ncbi:MAG: SGNH/GDSL hydrolase family protein [Lachnospiraceae bacterium]|nr:SGNH/GDSL hydrolase family protein [Lachnospiraceae bacterium]
MQDREENTNENRRTVFSIRFSIPGVIITFLALVTFGIIFWMFLKNENRRDYREDQPEIILSGDSIFAYYQDERSVASRLSEISGKKVFDASFGGTYLAYHDRDARLDDTSDAMSMVALTSAIINNDFRYQKNAHISANGTEYFDERTEALEKTDFGKAKILIVEYMLNDYHSGITIESGSDIYDEYTYEGALRSVVTQLKKAYPDLRIIIAGAPVTWYEVTHGIISSYERDFGGGNAEDYREVQKAVAEELEVEYMDLSEAYDLSVADNIPVYTADGIHPNEAGAEALARYIWEYICADAD